VVAAEGLRELGGLPVADRAGHPVHGQGGVLQELGGAGHAHPLQVRPEGRVARLGEGALELPARRGQPLRDLVEGEILAVLALHYLGRLQEELAAAIDRRGTHSSPLYAASTGSDRSGRLALVQVREGMSHVVVTVNPDHTLREAATAMSKREVGAAVVVDPEQPGPGIITERDILKAVASSQSPDSERVADHLTARVTFATPEWSLEKAAEAMVRGGFRHLVVVDGSDMIGVLSMRDIVRCWVTDGATSEMPG
jgi:CBS domain-containing protein